MTLNMTILTERTIYQSADYRLTSLGSKRSVLSDSSPKLITLGFGDWSGLVSYTGIGRWAGRDTSEYVLDWLTGIDDASIADIADRIRERGTVWLNGIEGVKRRDGQKRPRERHTLILAAFDAGGPQITVISNFEDCRGRNSTSAESTLESSTKRTGARPILVVTGCKSAVSRIALHRLKRLLRDAPGDPGRIRRTLIEINKEAAGSSSAQDTISSACSVVSFRADGQGVCDADGPVHIRSMSFGIAGPSRQELAKLLGFDPGESRGMTFASSGPRIPYEPCHPRVVNPDSAGGYALHELRHDGFESLRALDVNEAGIVIGDATRPGRPGKSFLWTYSVDGLARVSEFVATAGAINIAGTVAAKATMTDGSVRAVRWHGDTPVDLGCYKGRDSGAVGINDDGLAVGWVCIDPVDRGQINFRPAWSMDSLRVLEEFVCDWGQAVDVNAAGVVLVVGYIGSKCRAIQWNPVHGRYDVIGRIDGIHPSRITDDGMVLGTARDHKGQTVACLARPGMRWERLGTPAGFYATAMNADRDVVGAAVQDGYERPWLRRSSGEIIWLPYFDYHWCRPSAINNSGVIVGTAQTDHGTHALIWTR